MQTDLPAPVRDGATWIELTINGEATRPAVTPAVLANAIWRATGRRVRDLPITIDKVFAS